MPLMTVDALSPLAACGHRSVNEGIRESLKESKKMAKLKTLTDLFAIELRYAYDCEQKLVKKGLPSMIESANSPELRTALENHLEQTRDHVIRLEKDFAALGLEPDTKGNDIIDKITSAARIRRRISKVHRFVIAP
jgi:membrane-anchored glycerophosphoryl diester phosphodiesterase (GDPDase)